MADILTTNTFRTTYKDDYADSDNYYRILYNAGRPLQARELTQSQSIIQNEMTRFGTNIFRDGSVVRAGNITLNNTIDYIKLDTQFNPLPGNYLDMIGEVFTVKSPNPNIKVQILDILLAENGDPATLYVKYVDTLDATSGEDPIKVPNSAILENNNFNQVKVASSDAVGKGTIASTESGDYFVKGRFVFAAQQKAVISRYSTTPTTDIGFKIIEDIVTVDDNINLYDNQGETPNAASPGADRYRIRMILTSKDEIQAGENFVYLARIVNGQIIDTANPLDAYNKINDAMALRTREESGNYVVKPFIAKFDDLNDSNIQADITAGIAYVDGFRLDIPAKKIPIFKAQNTITLESQNTIAQYGNYVVGNAADNLGLPDIESYESVNLKSTSNHGGATLGTARIRAVQEDGANHNYYLFDIQMLPGNNFRDVKSFGTSGTNYVNIILEDGVAVLKGTANNSLLFSLPNQRPSLTGVNITGLTVQKKYQFTTNGSGNFAGLPATGTFTFTDVFQWVTTQDDGTIVTPTVVLSNGDQQASFSGLDTNTNYTVYAYVAKGTIGERTKTLTIGEELTINWPADAETDVTGNRYVDLGTADIYNVSLITQDDSAGADLSTNFVIDNGQRDNYYAKGRLIEKGGVSIPTGQIFVRFDHFTHGASGDFFSVNSYNGVVNYENIPTHKKANNEVVSLRDVLDFRPVQDVNGDFVGAEGKIFLLPQNTDAISGDVEYYMPRKDRLVASIENSRDGRFGRGSLQVVRGVPSMDPQFPEIPTGTIPLYDISLNAFTLNKNDMSTSFYANKRYTMKDISRLEQRVDDLTELTTLSLLELNTTSVTILDSNGLSRTKSGFLADNFTNYSFSEIESEEYKASIDMAENTLTCQQYPHNIRLLYDNTDVANTTTLKGDLLLLPYSTNNSLVIQDQATETININPFSVITSTGHMDLSPSSDNWVETQWAADNIVDGGTVTQEVGGTRRVRSLATWRNSWFGRPSGDRVQVITGSRVIRDLVGERVIEIDILPFMRSVKVGFRVQGLRPLTRYFPYFDGTKVDDWVKQELSFTRFAETTEDYGNIYTNATEHPDGSSSLVTDAEGQLSGSFVVPSTNSLRFRTGSKQFKLLDISVDNEAAATSNSRATFTANGVLETVQRTVRHTRQLDLQWIQEEQQDNRDPLAQSFRIDQFEYPNGLFLTKVRLFFATKDNSIPVQVQIRTMENGVPTGGPIPNASKFVSAADVNIPSDPNNLQIVRVTPTDFEFDEPVYLNAGQEYCFVVMAESNDYNTYCAKTYDFILGSTEARVTGQPTLGSLFLSQNASTWTPDQARDLMFGLYRARFAPSATALLENGAVPSYLLDNNPFLTSDGTSTIRVFHEGHGMIKNDKVLISGLDSSQFYGGIIGTDILGTRTVGDVDHTGYTFTADSVASSSIRTGGSNVTSSQNVMFDTYIPTVATLSVPQTQISGSIQLTEGASFGAGRNSLSNSAYAKQQTSTDITLNEINPTTSAKIVASPSNETQYMSNQKSVSLTLSMSTEDDRVSPIIDLQRSSFTGFENIIDNQDSVATAGFNVPLSFVDETHPNSGSSSCKHVTRPITLQADAVGLKIIFGANRPAAASFSVYYKISAGDEPLDNINWVEVDAEATVPSDDDRETFRQYEYLAGGPGGALNTFNTFQVKIVMHTTNSSRIPSIKDLRVIALAT